MKVLVIATHSNYRHWQYLVEAGINQRNSFKDVVFVDARGIANNDKNAFLLQRLEQIAPINLINISNKYMRSIGICVKSIRKRHISNEINLKQRELNHVDFEIFRRNAELHQICESGFLDSRVDTDYRIINEIISGYVLMKKILSENSFLELVIMSHGRLPIQLGMILLLKELGISFIGVQQGGSSNSFHVIAGGVHNLNEIRNELAEFSSSWNPKIKERDNFTFFYERELRNSRFTKKMKSEYLPNFLSSRNYAVFFTGSDGEDVFVIEKEKTIDFYRNEIEAISDFVKICKEKNLLPVVRLHPGYAFISNRIFLTERISKIKKISDEIYVIDHDSGVNSYHLGIGAVISVSYHSTIGLELSYLGKPVLFCGPTYFSSILEKIHVNGISEMRSGFENLFIVELEKLQVIYEWNLVKGTKFSIFSSQGKKNYIKSKRVLSDSRLREILSLIRRVTKKLKRFLKSSDQERK